MLLTKKLHLNWPLANSSRPVLSFKLKVLTETTCALIDYCYDRKTRQALKFAAGQRFLERQVEFFCRRHFGHCPRGQLSDLKEPKRLRVILWVVHKRISEKLFRKARFCVFKFFSY